MYRGESPGNKKARFRGLLAYVMPMIFYFFAGLAAISSSWVARMTLPSRPAFCATLSCSA
jgi:hypothetical protein